MDCIRPFIGIITCLWPSCVTHANYLYKLQENGDSLEKALNELKNARDDVQKKVDDAEANPNVPMKRNDQVNGWLQSVTAIEGEVLEILRQVDQQTSRRCLGGCCPNCWSDYMVGGSIVQYIAFLDELRKKGGFEEVAYKLPPLSVQEEPTNTTVGMKSMFDKVWKLLADDEVRTMGLYGYGGVGKTTLLKQINNAFLKSTTTSSSSSTHGFDVVILVVVSKVINIHAIQKEIGNRLGLSSPDRKSIFNALTKKSFVLLLDDIWETVDLQSIGVPPPPENSKSSKVIFTTRSETVCGHMDANIKFRVECLPWDEAWTLFQDKVGNETLNSHPDVPELAKDVARECGGLPLPLITISRAMSSKKTVHEWNHAITTLRKSAPDFPGMSEEVLPLLKRSYDSLRNDTIKYCFLYCALFPEYKSIYIPKLIDYWIGEGLILLNEFDHIDEARNHGHNIIGILKSACLLESIEYGETSVKMHGVIRDLALWITGGCGSSKRDKMLSIETCDLMAEKLYNAERIYLRPPLFRIGETGVGSPPKSPNLLTLIFEWTHGMLFIPHNFFEFTPLLRVLDLSNCNMETFPICITELLELRYLSLHARYIKALPEELGKLVKLNFLDLSYMDYLRTIPSGVIGNLLELRVLNLFGSGVWDLDEVCKLKHLNDLGIGIDTQHNLNKLLSNQSLQMCTRYLYLISCSPPSLLEKLELLSNLKTLILDTYTCLPESNMGVWKNHYYHMTQQQQHQQHQLQPFQNLSEIEILFCHSLKDLTWVGYVPNLKTLKVDNCNELEEIIVIVVVDDLRGGSTGGGDEISTRVMNNVEDVFKRLKSLVIIDLPKLKSICRNALIFPCLETVEVSYCPQLKKLPFDSASNVNNTLHKIKGGPKWWNELQWEVEEDHNNNNNNSELLKSKFLPYFDEVPKYEWSGL